VLVGSVIGFPHGATPVNIKVFETEQAIQAGAVEIDMVVNVGKVLDEDWDYIRNELASIREVTKKHRVILKVIFENDYLNQDRHKIKLSKLCSEVQVDYIKTSTGYGFVKGDDSKYSYTGATDHDLRLMRKAADPSVQVKAAGGVKNLDDLLRVRELGCTRVGATATVEILEEAKARFGSEY
jgi:deoxyribose-phosphate aldolase